jgi:hypothetical protein
MAEGRLCIRSEGNTYESGGLRNEAIQPTWGVGKDWGGVKQCYRTLRQEPKYAAAEAAGHLCRCEELGRRGMATLLIYS